MTFFRHRWRRASDDEYIAKLRRTMALWDRWRWWLILPYVGLLVFTIWLFSTVISLLIALAQPDGVPFALLGFVTGAVVGIAFGWMIQGIFWGLILGICGFRAERLLLKYLDGHETEGRQPDQPPEQESAFPERYERVNRW